MPPLQGKPELCVVQHDWYHVPVGADIIRPNLPSIKHTSAAAPSQSAPPEGEPLAKSSTRQRQRCQKNHKLTDAPVLFPRSTSSRLSTKKGNCAQVSTRDFSLGVWGMFLFLGKRNIPQKAARPDVQSVSTQTPARHLRTKEKRRSHHGFCPPTYPY